MTEQPSTFGSGMGMTPLGGAPGQGGPSLEEEERAMKRGRGRMMAAMIGSVLLAAAALAWFIARQQPNEYGQLGRQINGMRQEHFDVFWACALPREDLRDLQRAEQLIAEIAERAATPRAYAQHVREQCLVRLDEHLAPLAALIVPDDLREGVAQLQAAIEAQRTAWRAFLGHLAQIDRFDAEDETTRTMLTAIARGWYDYKVAHNALNGVIRRHLSE